MVDLAPRSAAHGLLPVTHGRCILTEPAPMTMTSLMAFQGQAGALDRALLDAHALTFPAPNRMTVAQDACCVWTGRGQAFLIGPDPDAGLARHAALTDQSDAWVTLDLTGPDTDTDTVAVLARLVPIDLRTGVFPPDGAARTQVQHAAISLHRIENGFRIRGFRSMAQTLVHEIADAMAAVAARAALH